MIALMIAFINISKAGSEQESTENVIRSIEQADAAIEYYSKCINRSGGEKEGREENGKGGDREIDRKRERGMGREGVREWEGRREGERMVGGGGIGREEMEV